MSKSNTQVSQVTQTTSNVPEYARPFYEDVMRRAQAESNRQYTPYGQERIAGFTPAQLEVQQNVMGLQSPDQYNVGSAMAEQAGLQALASSQYNPYQYTTQGVTPEQVQAQQAQAERIQAQQVQAAGLQQYQMRGPADVQAQQIQAREYTSPEMRAAQTGFRPELQQYQMEGPQQFGGQQASQYMSPYQQNVTDIQKREAIRDAKQGQLVQDLGAARQGTYGGSRQLLASLERERNLGQQMGDIQARGSQSAYENAQAQFERDRAAGLTTGQANLQARLGVQQLGTQTGLQVALANLDAESQSRVQNLAAQLQTQGLNAQQAMQAAMANQQASLQASLANQQAGLTVGQQNLAAQLQTQGLSAQQAMQAALANQQADLTANQSNQQYGYQASRDNQQAGLQAALANQQAGLTAGQFNSTQNLEAQRLGEQSRQFGSQQGLAGAQAAGQMAQTLGNLGQYQQQSNLSRLQAQGDAAGMQQRMEQQRMDMSYGDFQRQQNYPMEQLGNYSNIIRGLPIQMNNTQTTATAAPSMFQQAVGTGLSAASMYNMYR
jgi:hypothetical protein